MHERRDPFQVVWRLFAHTASAVFRGPFVSFLGPTLEICSFLGPTLEMEVVWRGGAEPGFEEEGILGGGSPEAVRVTANAVVETAFVSFLGP